MDLSQAILTLVGGTHQATSTKKTKIFDDDDDNNNQDNNTTQSSSNSKYQDNDDDEEEGAIIDDKNSYSDEPKPKSILKKKQESSNGRVHKDSNMDIDLLSDDSRHSNTLRNNQQLSDDDLGDLDDADLDDLPELQKEAILYERNLAMQRRLESQELRKKLAERERRPQSQAAQAKQRALESLRNMKSLLMAGKKRKSSSRSATQYGDDDEDAELDMDDEDDMEEDEEEEYEDDEDQDYSASARKLSGRGSKRRRLTDYSEGEEEYDDDLSHAQRSFPSSRSSSPMSSASSKSSMPSGYSSMSRGYKKATSLLTGMDTTDGDQEPSDLASEEITYEDALKLCLGRDRLIRMSERNWFVKSAPGFFVKAPSGTQNGKNTYRFALIFQVIEHTGSHASSSHSTTPANNISLELLFGNSHRVYPLSSLSNAPVTEAEFRRWLYELRSQYIVIPSRQIAQEMMNRLQYLENLPVTEAEINEMLQRKQMLRSAGGHSGSSAAGASAKSLPQKQRLLLQLRQQLTELQDSTLSASHANSMDEQQIRNAMARMEELTDEIVRVEAEIEAMSSSASGSSASGSTVGGSLNAAGSTAKKSIRYFVPSNNNSNSSSVSLFNAMNNSPAISDALSISPSALSISLDANSNSPSGSLLSTPMIDQLDPFARRRCNPSMIHAATDSTTDIAVTNTTVSTNVVGTSVSASSSVASSNAGVKKPKNGAVQGRRTGLPLGKRPIGSAQCQLAASEDFILAHRQHSLSFDELFAGVVDSAASDAYFANLSKRNGKG